MTYATENVHAVRNMECEESLQVRLTENGSNGIGKA